MLARHYLSSVRGMANQVVVGIDPSSQKVALVITHGSDMSRVDAQLLQLPKDQDYAKRCGAAFILVTRVMRRVASRYPAADIHVFIEEPVVGRGGARSTITQSKVHGAIVAACHCSGVVAGVSGVNNSSAKKQVVGMGNASKPEIRRWARMHWPTLEAQIKTYNAGDQQDIADAGMINRAGWKVIQMRERLIRYRSLESIKSRKRRRIE